MLKLGVPVLFVVGVLGCGGGGSPGGGAGGGGGGGVQVTTYALDTATGIDIPAGSCAIVNAQPQTLPLSTVSYSVVDEYNDDNLEVGVVPSTDTCQFNPNQAFIDDIVVGSATDSGQAPAGTYDLDIICQNLASDCLVSSATWSATY